MKCTLCGKDPPQSGSLTQWLGMGDYCKCRLLENKEQNQPSSLDAVCPLCGLHLHRNTGSLTQWAFRRQTCTCLPILTAARLESSGAIEAKSPHHGNPLKTPGSLIGRQYEVIDFLGEGGASAVYKVKHKLLEKEFAVKILLPNRIPSGGIIKRFQQEGRSIGRLKHKHIVAVHEFEVDENNQPFLVMDFLEGKTLSTLINETGGIEPIRAAALFQQIAEALEHAHEKSVIHRDLKPNNVVIVSDDNGNETVKLVDFGIAKLEEDASTQDTLTKTGEIFGSPHYMSPEQCKGQELDHRADIYSLGCLMYETLTGTNAAEAATVFDILMKHINGLSVNLDATACGITLAERSRQKQSDGALQYKCFSRLKLVIDGCLQVQPDKRYASATAVKKDLALVRGGNEPQGPSAHRGYLAQKSLSRKLKSSANRGDSSADRNAIAVAIMLLIGFISLVSIAVGPYLLNRETKKQKVLADASMKDMLDAARDLQLKSSAKHLKKKKKLESFGQSTGSKKAAAKPTGDPHYFPLDTIGTSVFLFNENTWSLLASDGEGFTVQLDRISWNMFHTLDELACTGYILRNETIIDDMLDAISRLKNMEELYLCRCAKVTPAGIAQLRGASKLNALHIQNMVITNEWISELAKLQLTAISFKDSVVTPEMIEAITAGSRLKYINLENQAADRTVSLADNPNWRLQEAADGSKWYCRAKGK